MEYTTTHYPRIAIQLPIISLPCLIPDVSVIRWNSKGLKALDNIMVGPTIKIFRTLQVEYNISPNDYLTFLQISHFLRSNQSLNISMSWKIVQLLTNPNTKLRGISLMYIMLNYKDNFIKSSPTWAWEHELGEAYTSEQWQYALTLTYSATKSINL